MQDISSEKTQFFVIKSVELLREMKIAKLLVATVHASSLDLDYFENTDVNYKKQFQIPLTFSFIFLSNDEFKGQKKAHSLFSGNI